MPFPQLGGLWDDGVLNDDVAERRVIGPLANDGVLNDGVAAREDAAFDFAFPF